MFVVLVSFGITTNSKVTVESHPAVVIGVGKTFCVWNGTPVPKFIPYHWYVPDKVGQMVSLKVTCGDGDGETPKVSTCVFAHCPGFGVNV